MTLLRLEGLVKRFGGLLVSDAVSLSVARGELVAVIGPNGAGKTTLVNQIAGELQPDAGRILLEGRDITAWPVHARARAGLGRSYQINAAIADFSVLENLLLASQPLGAHSFRFWQAATRPSPILEQAREMIGCFDLEALRDRRVSTLAYGQQRLVELAMALACRPRLLLLDEPMAGLGPAESEEVVAILQKMRKDYGIVLIEHDMQAVFTLADRIVVLVQGRVVFEGSPAQVRESAVVREAYLGDEETHA